jgi:flagellar basal body-associated protein FliL
MDDSIQEEKTTTQELGVAQQKPKKVRGRGGKANVKFIFIVILIIAVIAFGVWFIFFTEPEHEIDDKFEPTPTIFEETLTPTPAVEAVDKSEITIQILNGTGVAGEAAFFQGKLEDLDYSEIEVGNTKSQDYDVTEVRFSDSVSKELKDEIKSALENAYKDVEEKSGADDYDVEIILGFREGQTPTPKPTSKPASSPTPTATESATPTP